MSSGYLMQTNVIREANNWSDILFWVFYVLSGLTEINLCWLNKPGRPVSGRKYLIEIAVFLLCTKNNPCMCSF